MNRVLRDTGAKYPIVQAPMGWIARSKLASAVSNAGGLGVIETSSGEVDICKEEIKKMTSLTDKPFGINLPLLFLKDSSMVDFCVDNNVNFVTTSAGDPSKYIKVLKDADITVYHAVPNLQGALKAFEAGVDGLVVEGTEGGGFKGYEEIGLAVLIQAIKKEINLVESSKFDKIDNPLKNAPHTYIELASNEWNHKYTREEAAFPNEYVKNNKYWAPVARVDNVYGDRNLVCSCPSMDEYKDEAA